MKFFVVTAAACLLLLLLVFIAEHVHTCSRQNDYVKYLFLVNNMLSRLFPSLSVYLIKSINFYLSIYSPSHTSQYMAMVDMLLLLVLICCYCWF